MKPKGIPTSVLDRLHKRVMERWVRWHLLRWCAGLPRINLTELDRAIAKMARGVESKSIDSTHGSKIEQRSMNRQTRLEGFVAELSDEQRRILSLLQQGATYRQIAGALNMSDKRALRIIAALLCELADEVGGTSAAVD